MSEQLDTFDDGPYTDGSTTGAGYESFDDDEALELSDVQDQKSESDQKDGQKTNKREEIDPDSQVNLLDEKEEEKAVREEKAEKGDKDSESTDEESDDSKTDKDSNPDETPEFTGKTIKAFFDGKALEVPQEAEIRVKVDGKNEKVPVQELINNYSGKVAWDKKFTELSQEKEGFKAELKQYQEEKEYIGNTLAGFREIALKGLKGEANPIDFVNNILDFMNINTYDYNRALREHLSEEFEMYSQMTEVEREAFWLKQKNEYLERKQETSIKSTEQQQARAELERKVDELRQTHGVSEEQFVSAHKDLIDLGYKDITPEQIVNYASMVEPTLKAQDLVKPYEDQLSDEESENLIITLAREFKANPRLTIDEVKKFLAEEFEVETIVSSLKTKVEPSSEPIAKKKDSDYIETFDDFDY